MDGKTFAIVALSVLLAAVTFNAVTAHCYLMRAWKREDGWAAMVDRLRGVNTDVPPPTNEGNSNG